MRGCFRAWHAGLEVLLAWNSFACVESVWKLAALCMMRSFGACCLQMRQSTCRVWEELQCIIWRRPELCASLRLSCLVQCWPSSACVCVWGVTALACSPIWPSLVHLNRSAQLGFLCVTTWSTFYYSAPSSHGFRQACTLSWLSIPANVQQPSVSHSLQVLAAYLKACCMTSTNLQGGLHHPLTLLAGPYMLVVHSCEEAHLHLQRFTYLVISTITQAPIALRPGRDHHCASVVPAQLNQSHSDTDALVCCPQSHMPTMNAAENLRSGKLCAPRFASVLLVLQSMLDSGYHTSLTLLREARKLQS